MAYLIETKATFPKSGGLSVADGAVSVNAGNGLHVNPSTGMVDVPVNTTAGLGYGSNGLEVEVDGSTIDFNSTGKLTALGGGSTVEAAMAYVYTGKNETIGKWTITYSGNANASVLCLYSDNWLYIGGISASNSTSTVSITIKNTDGSNLTVNGIDPVNEGTVCQYGNSTVNRAAPFYKSAHLTFLGYGHFYPCSILVYK